MENQRSVSETFSFETYNAALRTWTDTFTEKWQEAQADRSEEGLQRFREHIETLRQTAGHSNLLHNAIAAAEPIDSLEKHKQMIALLEGLAYTGDEQSAVNTLDLLGDIDNPLWHNRRYSEFLGLIALRVPPAKLAGQMVAIAKDIAESPGQSTEVYHRYLDRLTGILSTVKAIEKDKIDKEDAQGLDEAMDVITQMKHRLRPFVLAEIDGAAFDDEWLGKYAIKAIEELNEVQDKSNPNSKNLSPIYYLKAAPGLEEAFFDPTLELDVPHLLGRHNLIEREMSPHPLLPTIGIEIEVRKSDALPEAAVEWSDDQKDFYLLNLKSQYDDIRHSGVPADDNDNIAFHEFAFNPVNDYLTLSRQVQMLMKRGYIPQELRPPVMHITVGGVEALLDERGENGAFTLCRIMEATMWSASHRRLSKKYSTTTTADGNRGAVMGWDSKGLSGVLDKKYDIFHDEQTSSEMVEFRTFQLRSLPGMNRTLAAFQTLGAALIAAQNIEKADAHENGSIVYITPEEFTLSEAWHTFEEDVETLFIANGLKNPKRPYTPLQPENDTKGRYASMLGEEKAKEESGILAFIELLKAAEKDSHSQGGEFVNEARRLVTATCHKISRILSDSET